MKILKWLTVFVLVLFCTVESFAQLRADMIKEYIKNYQELAINEMKRSGVPAAITLAQGILETDAGKSDLVLSSNNHFGIKCKSIWKGEKVYHDDDMRGECFRKYPTAADSYTDHSDYLRTNTRYDFLFRLEPEDYKAWAKGLRSAGYATNPRYADVLINYIETYNLNQFSLIAMGKLPAISNDSAIVAINTKHTSAEQTQSSLFLENISLSTGEVSEDDIKFISVKSIKNSKENPQSIKGQRIKHIVKKNDTLSAITKKYGVSQSLVAEWNNLKKDKLMVGQELWIYK